MPFRFITKSIHAYLIDYPVAIVLMVAPFLLKLGQSGPVALWLSVVTGVAAPLPLQTTRPRVFAIGDVRSGSTKRVASAVGEGAGVVAQIHALFGAAATTA